MSFPEWMRHSVWLRTFKLDAKVRLKAPLRVGVGRAVSLTAPTDLPVLKISFQLRDGRSLEVPAIAGSSWKGVFRSTAYRLAKAHKLKVCEGLGEQNCIKPLERQLRNLLGQGSTSEALALVWENVCILCKIFGAPGLASKVIFEDSYPAGLRNGEPQFDLGYRTGIAIDRRTGAVFRRALYTVEFIQPGCEFSFSMTATNLPNYCLGLLMACLLEVEAGRTRIGGFKSRGFGKVGFEELRIDVLRPAGSGARGLESLDGQDEALEEFGEPPWEGEDAWRIVRKLAEVWRRYARRVSSG